MNMRERVARALAKQAWARFTEGDSSFALHRYPGGGDEYEDRRWRFYESDADAVLDALMEWTPEMHEAGLRKFAEMHGRAPSTQLLNSYHAMIQAARDGK